MLQYVPYEQLAGRHLQWLSASLLSCPGALRPTAESIIQDLADGGSKLFEWDDGCLMVSKRDKRLVMESFATDPGISMELCRLLAADLKRLAADWQCDMIETLCFDARFTSVIKHLGGHVESQTLVLEVGNGKE